MVNYFLQDVTRCLATAVTIEHQKDKIQKKRSDSYDIMAWSTLTLRYGLHPKSR